MFSHEGSERHFSHNAKLAVALSLVAGAINASGFMVVGTYTSHVTGQVARFGDELAMGRMSDAYIALALFGFFLFGAITAGVIIFAARSLGRFRFALALLLEAGILSAFVYLAAKNGTPQGTTLLKMTGLLCFAMGLQNALVTKVSGAVIRTTHLTGVTTDLGIEIARLGMLFRRKIETTGISSVGAVFNEQNLMHPELHKAWLHFTIICSFFTGAIAGPFLFLKIGYLSMLAPTAALLVLVGYDLTQGAAEEFKFLGEWLKSKEPAFLTTAAHYRSQQADSAVRLLGCDWSNGASKQGDSIASPRLTPETNDERELA